MVNYLVVILICQTKTTATMNYFQELRNIENRIATIREEAAKLLGLPLFASYVQKLQAELDRLLTDSVGISDYLDSRI